MAESIWGRIRRLLVSKQLMIFLCMIAVGAVLLIANEWTGDRVGDGIVFIIIGFVGILMSWTTFDIGAGIKEVVREVGRQNKEAIDSMARSQESMNERIIASLDSLAKSQDSTNERIIASLDSLAKSQDNMAKSQEKLAGVLTRIEKKMDRED